MKTNNESEKKYWSSFWQRYLDDPLMNTKDKWDWSPMDRGVLNAILQEVPAPKGLPVLETGSGTAKVSAMLARMGALVTLVDIVPQAIQLGRRLFDSLGLTASYHVADIESLPFADESFNIVWNSGVMEHFTGEEQFKVFEKLVRVLKKGGLLITINPNASSIFYRLGKYYSEITGTWPIFEQPVESLSGCLTSIGLHDVHEFATGFESSLMFFNAIPGTSKYNELIMKWYNGLSEQEKLKFPGYLLVSVGKKA